MPYKLIFHPTAQKEYTASIEWYLERSIRAASNFIKSVDKGFSSLRDNPKKNRNIYKHYFQYILLKYPFTIIYTIEVEQHAVVIIVIYHQKRVPENKYR